MYSDEIKRSCRKIRTGLTGQRNLSILRSVEGQLSDGMWEESARMEGYWLFEYVGSENDEVIIYVSNALGEMRFDRFKYNAFRNMDDEQIRQWFGKKIKQIIKQEIADNWEDHPIVWKEDCEVVSKYMHDDLTVKECYDAYNFLLRK